MSPTRVLAAALVLVFCAFFPAAGLAGTQDGAVVALHAKAHTTKSASGCTTAAPTLPCSQYTTLWPLYSAADVYLVVAHADPVPGIAGVSCGISYDPTIGEGVDLFGWFLCADLEYPNSGYLGEWPESGGGNRITWSAQDACQRHVIGSSGVHAIAGWFYVFAYSTDQLIVTENRNLMIPELAVADCAASTSYLPFGMFSAARVGFGGDAWGSNPCEGDVLTTPTTWGRVKRSFAE